MTIKVVVLYGFFEIEKDKQEDDPMEFLGDIFPELHFQIKRFTFVRIHLF